MPYISAAQRKQLLDELAVVNAQWQHINRFLADEDEAISPIYLRWLEQQKSQNNFQEKDA